MRVAAEMAGGDTALVERNAGYMQAIARLSEVRIADTLPAGPAPAAVSGNTRLMLDIKVDLAAERARLAKEVERVSGEVTRARAQLANESFTVRAPAAVVQQLRERAAGFETTLLKLSEQLAQLGPPA